MNLQDHLHRAAQRYDRNDLDDQSSRNDPGRWCEAGHAQVVRPGRACPECGRWCWRCGEPNDAAGDWACRSCRVEVDEMLRNMIGGSP
jgi:hypothetical protein